MMMKAFVVESIYSAYSYNSDRCLIYMKVTVGNANHVSHSASKRWRPCPMIDTFEGGDSPLRDGRRFFRDQLCDLANGNGLTLVSESESA